MEALFLKDRKPTFWIMIAAVIIFIIAGFGLLTDPITKASWQNYDLTNFYVNGYMLGADTHKMDTSMLTPAEPLDAEEGYDFNFEEIRYSVNKETGRLKRMIVNVYDTGVISMMAADAKNKENVSLDSNETYQIEGIVDMLGKGKTGWYDKEQRLRYMEYLHKEGRLSATVRFVYTDSAENGIIHRLVWVIAESSLPYSYPMPIEAGSITDRRPMLMVEGEIYLDTGKQMPVEIDVSAILGTISSSVKQSEIPKENGESNFGYEGAPYAFLDDGLAVLLNNEWTFFERNNKDAGEFTNPADKSTETVLDYGLLSIAIPDSFVLDQNLTEKYYGKDFSHSSQFNGWEGTLDSTIYTADGLEFIIFNYSISEDTANRYIEPLITEEYDSIAGRLSIIEAQTGAFFDRYFQIYILSTQKIQLLEADVC